MSTLISEPLGLMLGWHSKSDPDSLQNGTPCSSVQLKTQGEGPHAAVPSLPTNLFRPFPRTWPPSSCFNDAARRKSEVPQSCNPLPGGLCPCSSARTCFCSCMSHSQQTQNISNRTWKDAERDGVRRIQEKYHPLPLS